MALRVLRRRVEPRRERTCMHALRRNLTQLVARVQGETSQHDFQLVRFLSTHELLHSLVIHYR
jgi:hypothetical protein